MYCTKVPLSRGLTAIIKIYNCLGEKEKKEQDKRKIYEHIDTHVQKHPYINMHLKIELSVNIFTSRPLQLI